MTTGANEPVSETALSKMRHDLRTPINHILGYSEMLAEDVEAAGRQNMVRDLNKIQTGGRQLIDLITDRLCQAGDVTAEALADMFSVSRVPINHIMGYAQILLEEATEAGQPGWEADIARIAKAAQTWFETAERLMLPRDEIHSTKRFRRYEESNADPDSPADTIFIAKAIASEHRFQGRLLVVDDDRENRDVLACRLQRHGHTVETANTGEEALDSLKTGKFDLLLLNVIIPGMHGDEVLERIKSDTFLKDLPVIMISVSDRLNDVIRCISLGAEDYLPKPCDPVLLKVRIDAVLEKKQLRDKERAILAELQTAHEKSESLLLNLLPASIAVRLKDGEKSIVDSLSEATVLFADLAGFTPLCQELSALEIVSTLDQIFAAFDQLAKHRQLEKIKTIGAAYMAVGGVPNFRPDHAEAIADLALDMIAKLGEIVAQNGLPLELRIGIDTGPVIAGVIGQDKFSYDLWGNTVNTASRMESLGAPGRIQVSQHGYEQLKDSFQLEARDSIEVKGKGTMPTWWLLGRKD
jgi:adenylate cyclase